MHAGTTAVHGLVGLAMGLALLIPARAAQLNTESFSAGRAGWTNEGNWTVQATNQYLRGSFPAQGIPLPESASWRAGDTASGGAFTGDYVAAGAEMIGFSFFAEQVLPSELQIRLVGVSNTFFRSVVAQLIATGLWHHIDLSLESAAEGGWTGGDEQAFADIRRDVRHVSIQVFRSGAVLQRYRLDDVYLGAKPAMDDLVMSGDDIAGDWVHVRPGRAYRMESAIDPRAAWSAYGERLVATGMVLHVTLPDDDEALRLIRLRLDGAP